MSNNKSTSAQPQQHPKKKKRSVIQDSYFTNHHSSPKSTPTTPSSSDHTNHDDDNNNNNDINNMNKVIVDPILTILQQQFNEFIDDSVIELIYSNHELSFNEKLFHLTEMITCNNNVNHSPSCTISGSQEDNNNNNNNSNEISFLYDMFILPQQQQQQQQENEEEENEEHVFDRELIQIVLEENKNDIYATMNQLLQMNNGSDTLLDVVVVDDDDDDDDFEIDDDFLNNDDSSNMYDDFVEQQTKSSIVASPQKQQQQQGNNNNKKQQKKKKNQQQQQQQRKEQKKLQHVETIERLSEIFTRVDRDTIEATLIGHDNNADEAFRALSVMSPFLTMDQMNKKKQELKSKKNQSFRNADEYFGRKQGLVFNQWNSASISGGGGSGGMNNNSTKNVNNGLYNSGISISAKSYSIEEEPLTELDHLPSNQNTHLSLSDELKLEKLCSMFKDYDVGDDIVKNVFISCKCHFGLTIQRLYDLYPNVDSARRSAQNIIAPKMLQHVKQQQQQQKRSNQNQRQSTSSTFVNYDNSLKNDDYMSQVIDERVFINDDDPYNSSMHRRTGVQFAKIRNQFFTMALEAYMRGDGASAKELAEKGRKADRISKAEHMNASYSIFNHVNANKQSRDTKTIDLHGLHVSEALQILSQIIQSEKQELERDERNVRTLNVITGVGRNSAKGKAKVKPAVEAFLKREGYRIKTLSPGDLQITIKK